MLEQALLYDFELAGRRVHLWKRQGESYGHVLMKALGYAMFVGEYPELEVERRVGLRYKPDLVARGGRRARFLFWGECGATSVRKVAWLLKHARRRAAGALQDRAAASRSSPSELRAAIARALQASGRLVAHQFRGGHRRRAPSSDASSACPQSWYTQTEV